MQHDVSGETETNLVVYDARYGNSLSTVSAISRLFKNFWKWRVLALELFKRDFLAVYKRSFLGYIWIFITPIFSVFSYLFFNKIGVLKAWECWCSLSSLCSGGHDFLVTLYGGGRSFIRRIRLRERIIDSNQISTRSDDLEGPRAGHRSVWNHACPDCRCACGDLRLLCIGLRYSSR